MLLTFSVRNYLSFKEEATLSLEATAGGEREGENVIRAGRDRLLKGAVVYGANASGKSNLIRALRFMRDTVRGGGGGDGAAVDADPAGSRVAPGGRARTDDTFRLSTVSQREPALFEVSFLAGATAYRYGFRLGRERVEEEWLYHRPARSGEHPLFERDGSQITIHGGLRGAAPLRPGLGEDALFAPACAAAGLSPAVAVQRFFDGVVITGSTEEEILRAVAGKVFNLGRMSEVVGGILELADLGITGIELGGGAEGGGAVPGDFCFLRPKFDARGRQVGTVKFDFLREESEGTRKLFALAAYVSLCLRSGQILVIDEFDARLHPVVTKTLVNLYNSPENTSGAQLLLATHDTNLLTYGNYRPDQIWFMERKREGDSALYSLAEYELDPAASFQVDYIQGRFGAIPYLGDFGALLQNKLGEDGAGGEGGPVQK